MEFTLQQLKPSESNHLKNGTASATVNTLPVVEPVCAQRRRSILSLSRIREYLLRNSEPWSWWLNRWSQNWPRVSSSFSLFNILSSPWLGLPSLSMFSLKSSNSNIELEKQSYSDLKVTSRGHENPCGSEATIQNTQDISFFFHHMIPFLFFSLLSTFKPTILFLINPLNSLLF